MPTQSEFLRHLKGALRMEDSGGGISAKEGKRGRAECVEGGGKMSSGSRRFL